MQTIDLGQIMAKHDLTHTAARNKVRRWLKEGKIWSRLNPDLLSGEELLPCIAVDNPPRSAAEPIPFPIPSQRFHSLNPKDNNYLEALANEKIRWCYQGKPQTGSALRRRLLKQLSFYEVVPAATGSRYCWIELNPQTSPYRPLAAMIFPVLSRYALDNPVPPQPPEEVPGEAWFTPKPDAYGVSLHYSVRVEAENKLVLAVSLSGRQTFWLSNYRLDPDRYAFIRQQLLYLLGSRLEPWEAGTGQRPGSFRGLIYRKPPKA